MKNTSKEDSEQALKDGWEVAEPGRAELANKARLQYIVTRKKSLGEKLNEEDKKVLKLPPRIRKISMPANPEDLPKISSRDNLKGKKERIIDKRKEPEKEKLQLSAIDHQIDLNKPNLPTLRMHTSTNIRTFISYCYEERVNRFETVKESKITY